MVSYKPLSLGSCREKVVRPKASLVRKCRFVRFYGTKTSEEGLSYRKNDRQVIKMIFQQGKLAIRKLMKKDVPFLMKWLGDSDILRYYEGRDSAFDKKEIEEKFVNREDETTRCLVLLDNKPIGYFQYYPLGRDEKEEWYNDYSGIVYGTDQFIGEPAYWNHGIGTWLVRATCQFLTKELHADKVVMDPQTRNTRAVYVYEKCGFKKVRLLPGHEWHEGAYRDCWLMEYSGEQDAKVRSET